MASKDFILDGGIPLTIYKRRGSRNLRLSIAATGKVRVTIPSWAPYKAGLDFAKTRQAWITEQHKPASRIMNGQAIGKAHRISFEVSSFASKPSSRIKDASIVIKYPAGLSTDSAEVQKTAHLACVRALRQQAENLLPQRLAVLAKKHGHTYNGVEVKHLKGRWGSCDHNKHIILNLFLMQLPWNLIDYVLLHELTHTRVLRHGPTFWLAMEAVLPGAKQVRSELKQHQPILAQPQP